MKPMIVSAALVVWMIPALPQPVEAGAISSACMSSGRKAANRGLCKCIQFVADNALTRADQRLAAKFFKDPHMAQEIRQSDRAAHEAFWKRYKAFGSQAEAFCSSYRR